MTTVPFPVNLTHRDEDETTLTWETPRRILATRAFLCEDLTGVAPVWIHVEGAGCRRSFLFHPPCGAGSRRVSAMGFDLPARSQLKVWAVRAGGGGVLRVEVDSKALPTQKKTGAEQFLPAGL